MIAHKFNISGGQNSDQILLFINDWKSEKLKPWLAFIFHDILQCVIGLEGDRRIVRSDGV